MQVCVLAWALRPLSKLELHLRGLGVSMKLCNFLVYFLPLSVPLWSGAVKTLRSFTRAVCILAQGTGHRGRAARSGRGKCGEAARGPTAWVAEARTGAGRPPREHLGEEERRVNRPSRFQNEQPEGTSQEGGPSEAAS